jgi:hypothetical protein
MNHLHARSPEAAWFAGNWRRTAGTLSMSLASQPRAGRRPASLPMCVPRLRAAALLICLALCSATTGQQQQQQQQQQDADSRQLELSIQTRLQRQRRLRAAPNDPHGHTPNAKHIIKPCAPGCEEHGNCNTEEGRWAAPARQLPCICGPVGLWRPGEPRPCCRRPCWRRSAAPSIASHARSHPAGCFCSCHAAEPAALQGPSHTPRTHRPRGSSPCAGVSAPGGTLARTARG